jgi:hypothetical protein
MNKKTELKNLFSVRLYGQWMVMEKKSNYSTPGGALISVEDIV